MEGEESRSLCPKVKESQQYSYYRGQLRKKREGEKERKKLNEFQLDPEKLPEKSKSEREEVED